MTKFCRPRIRETEYMAAKIAASVSGMSLHDWVAKAIQEKYLRDTKDRITEAEKKLFWTQADSLEN
jgi:hypothetical protein